MKYEVQVKVGSEWRVIQGSGFYPSSGEMQQIRNAFQEVRVIQNGWFGRWKVLWYTNSSNSLRGEPK